MPDTKRDPMVPELGLWERADVQLGKITIVANVLYAAITGVFRGKSSPKFYSSHLLATAVRTLVDRLSVRQNQYLNAPTPATYKAVMEKRGLQPETVPLPHDAEGYWLGNKDAKNVLVFFHAKIYPTHNPEANLDPIPPHTGGGFALPATPAHFEFWLDLLKVANENGHDIAVFFPRYTQSPYATYPTQLRQATGALLVGGDSAGGNLAMAILLHLSHPHPEIEPISLSTPLAGVFGLAPWVNFSTNWPSFKDNAYKDLVTERALSEWSASYNPGKEHDAWSEPDRAPAEWWADAKTERILLLAGSDELLLSPIESFAKKVKSVFPNTTYIVGTDEGHDIIFYGNPGPEGVQTGNELRQWLLSRL
ncbi:hypothetical protein N7481_009408 [Penicillium waksmanii]|uniref:uncharacterized protein n=1 Tax=Penicillium waksmanii TaxID=69791 RepID=UPI00254700DE|nr:uncharacterized protein N7481_009408 [Penicillium waksmanii]KAJ5975701.1 hypothetical protein N7481_009408 [Penicillium waksmanii]